jgi:glycosyltransferase involved in cell wall biosynthesis
MRDWWARAGVPPDRLHRLPLGVDAARFTPAPQAARARPPAELALLCVARLAVENDLHLALRAAAALAAAGCPFRLTLIGDGPLRAELQSYARELGLGARVRWPGRVELAELPGHYRAAGVFLYTRRYGAPPRVALQAMACGLPIAGFAAAGLDSYVQHGGNGLLVPPPDVAALAAALLRLAGDEALRRQMGAASRRLVEEQYDWPLIVDRYEQLYAALLRR